MLAETRASPNLKLIDSTRHTRILVMYCLFVLLEKVHGWHINKTRPSETHDRLGCVIPCYRNNSMVVTTSTPNANNIVEGPAMIGSSSRTDDSNVK